MNHIKKQRWYFGGGTNKSIHMCYIFNFKNFEKKKFDKILKHDFSKTYNYEI